MDKFNSFRSILAVILRFGIGLLALIIELGYIYNWFGIVGIILGFVILPGTLVLIPFVVLFMFGDWLLLLLTLAYLFIPTLLTLGIEFE